MGLLPLLVLVLLLLLLPLPLVLVLVLVLEVAACPSAAEWAHGWLPVEALTPQHARAEDLEDGGGGGRHVEVEVEVGGWVCGR